MTDGGFFFQAEYGIRDAHYGLEFRRVLFRSMPSIRCLRGRIATSRASPQAMKPCNGGNWNAFRPVLKPNICCGKFLGDQFSDESIGQAADALSLGCSANPRKG